MGFRYRKRSGLLGGLLHLNWSKNGLSSISIGGPGSTVNIPVARSGGTRSTVGLPGTGLSWSEESRPSTSQRRQAQRPRQTSTEQIIDETMSAICGPTNVGDALWRQGLAATVINSEEAPRKVLEAALGVKSAEMIELRLRRARGVAATRREALNIIQDIQTLLAWTEQMGWSRPAD